LPLSVKEKALTAPVNEGEAGSFGQNYVGNLLGGDGRAGDFDFVFSWRGVEEIVAETVGGGGIGERLGERGVRVNER